MRLLHAMSIALGALAIGCGGGAGDRSPSPPASALDAYRAELGSACANARLDRAAVAPPAGASARALAVYLRANLDVERRYRAVVAALRPPPAIAAEHAEGVRLGRELVALARRAIRSARAGERPERVLRRLEPAVNRRIERGNALLEAIGVPQCRMGRLALGLGAP